MNRTLALLLSAGAFLGAADERANDFLLRLSAAGWGAALGGSLGFTEDGRTPDTADMATLGLDGTQPGYMVDVNFHMPIIFLPDVHVGMWRTGAEGAGNLSEELAIGDVVFTDGERVESTLTLTDLWAELSWRPIDLNIAGFAVGVALHAVDVHFEARSSSSTETFDETLPIPVLVLRGHVNPLKNLGFEAILHGVSYDGYTFADLRAQALWRPLDNLGVMAGWRHVAMQAEIDDGDDQAEIDLTLSGPYVGALLQF